VNAGSLAETLRARGMRMTAQRQLVLDAVRSLPHATPERVHAEVVRTAPSINITTVYRSLEVLEEVGLVTHTHLSHGAPSYHAAGERAHLHLVCRRCERITAVDVGVLDDLAERLAAERSFELDPAHVAFFGICGSCAADDPEAGPS
jgi:Fur family ferric uptake transcriptional regulator